MPTLPFPREIAAASRDSNQTTRSLGRIRLRSAATITLAVHPWYGEAVEVLRSYGSDGVFVERANGERRAVPESWTSLVPRVPCQLSDGQTIRLAPESALDLARWVAARLDDAKEERER